MITAILFKNILEKYENANLNLFDLQQKIAALSNELKSFKKTKNNIINDLFVKQKIDDIREEIIKATKDIETLRKKSLTSKISR